MALQIMQDPIGTMRHFQSCTIPRERKQFQEGFLSSPTPFVAQHQLRAASASEQIALPQRAGVCSVASMAWASASEPYCPAYLTRPNYIYPFVNCKPILFTVD